MGLVREQVLIGRSDDDRVGCSGPMLMLDLRSRRISVSCCMSLPNNARKYGALSVATGRCR